MIAQSSKGWFLFVVMSVLMSLVLGLVLVWLSIERTDLAYSIRKMRIQLENNLALKNKLEVERDILLSPYELGREAIKLKMSDAKAGQIRKIIK